MTLSKRIIGFFLDIVLFLILCEAIFFLLKCFSIFPSNTLIFFCAYSIQFFIPIVTTGNTIVNKILKIKIYKTNFLPLKSSLLLKSLVYYFLIFHVASALFIIIENLLNDFTVIKINRYTHLFVILTFFLANPVILILSKGYFNLLDYILKIKYKRYFKKDYSRDYKIAFLIAGIYVLLTTITFKFRLDCLLTSINNEVRKTFTSEYYPIDDLGSYLQEQYILTKIAQTNDVITLSDPTSLYLNNMLLKKDIISIINKKTFTNNKSRLKFCSKLVLYSKLNDLLSGKNLDQTQITLYYRERKSFFVYLTSVFKYYYDNKQPGLGIYGGIDRDELIKIYEAVQVDYVKKYHEALAKKFDLPIDTVEKYMDENGSLSLPESLISNIDTSVRFSTSVKIPGPKIPDLQSKIAFFNDVLPEDWLMVSAPTDEQIIYNFFGLNYLNYEEEEFYEIKRQYILGQPRN